HSRTAAGGVEVAVRQARDDGAPFEVYLARIAAGKAHDVVVVPYGEIAPVLDGESANDLRLVLSLLDVFKGDDLAVEEDRVRLDFPALSPLLVGIGKRGGNGVRQCADGENGREFEPRHVILL